ncbi:MAG TPA: endonuclease/exonuclease/phosphatase family protein [Acidimicrobiia bacterium]|nr:endonuclease/exonuclease/phosphatase family protein [Acidimicrobiia bacterium]
MRVERQLVAAGVAALVPWTWFLVRNRTLLLDVVATGLPVLFPAVAAGIGVYAAVRRRRLLAIGVVSWLVAGAVAVVGPWRPQSEPAPVQGFRVVAANVNSRNPTIGRAVANAVARGGDLVLLIEAGKSKWTPPPQYTTVIRPQYSAQVILSRFPARLLDKPAGWPKDFRAHRLEVEAPTGRIVVYLAHLKRPHLGPRRILGIRRQLQAQRRERESLLRSARAENVPVVVAGDFNTSDRSRDYRQITSRFRDAMRSEWSGPTYVRTSWRPFLLRIDHIFVPRNWCSARAERFALQGSDHRGLAVDIGPCPVP